MAIIEVDQGADTGIQTYSRKGVMIRYGYKRKLSRTQKMENSKGEDYLVFKSEKLRTIFVLCDGISSSYYGNLGSQLVGELILGWLWENFDGERVEDTAKELGEYLNNEDFSSTIVKNKKLPEAEGFLGGSLKKRREEIGTQSNFVCGVIDHASGRDGTDSIGLFILGDAKLHLFEHSGEKDNRFQHDYSSDEAWSSKDGVFGEIHAYQFFDGIDSIIAHSDGLDPVVSSLKPGLPEGNIEEFFSIAQAQKDDDISFLEIKLTGEQISEEDYHALNIRKISSLPKSYFIEGEESPREVKVSGQELPRRKKLQRKKYFYILFIVLTLLASWSITRTYTLSKLVQEQNNEEGSDTSIAIEAILTEIASSPNIEETVNAAVVGTMTNQLAEEDYSEPFDPATETLATEDHQDDETSTLTPTKTLNP